MQVQSRNNKRHNKKRKKKIFSILALVIIFAGACTIIFLKLSQKPIFLSPLPHNYKINSAPEKDQTLELLKRKLSAKKIEYTDIALVDNYYVIKLKDKSVVIISSAKDINAQLSSLQFILARLTMEGKAFSELDLRFDKPVIKLK